MSKIAKFAVSNEFLHTLMNLPSTCRVVFVTGGEFRETFDVYIECAEFPDAKPGDEVPRIKPVWERRDPVVLKGWGFEK